MAKKAIKGKTKADPAPAGKAAPSTLPPPDPPHSPAPNAAAAAADTDIPLPIPPPQLPLSRSRGSSARQVTWGPTEHLDDDRHSRPGVRASWRTGDDDDMYGEDGDFDDQHHNDPAFFAHNRDSYWEEQAAEDEQRKTEDLKKYDNWGSTQAHSPAGSHAHIQSNDNWHHWPHQGDTGGGSPSGHASVHGHDSWGGAGGSTHLATDPIQASNPPAPSHTSPPVASADDWAGARATMGTRGYSRASGKPASPPPPPPPNTRIPPTQLAAQVVQDAQHAMRTQPAQQPRQGRPPTQAPPGAAHPPRAPGPARSATMPVPMPVPMAGADPKKYDPTAYAAWMNWANEAGMGPKVATTIAANIHQPPGAGGGRSHAQQQQHPEVLASLHARFGQGTTPARSFQSGQGRAGLHGMRQRSQTVPAVHHADDGWGGGGGGSAHQDTWGGRGGDDGWEQPSTTHHDPWGGGGGGGGGKAKKRQSDWGNPVSGEWGRSQDNGWGGGGGGGGDWGDPQGSGWGAGGGGSGGGDWGDPQASTSKAKSSRHDKHKSEPGRRAPAMEQADSWGWGGAGGGGGGGGKGKSSGWGNDDWGAIPEEDEEYEDDYDDEWDDLGYDDGDYDDRHDRHGDGHRVRPDISYHLQSPNEGSGYAQPRAGGPLHGAPAPRPGPAEVQDLMHMDPHKSSMTMNIATGRPVTTAFDLKHPRNGIGENVFHDSKLEAVRPAQKALFGRTRFARDRIYWCFSPERDRRVARLLKWIDTMSNGLATIGLQHFLATGKRGALMSNVEYHTEGEHPQPTFDWVTKDQLRLTLDRIFQESVVTYNPAKTVVVFVFLLSASKSSMVCWRRKLPVPEDLRVLYQKNIDAILGGMDERRQVFVDELPPAPSKPTDRSIPATAAAAPPDKKKKKRGFWARLFGLK